MVEGRFTPEGEERFELPEFQGTGTLMQTQNREGGKKEKEKIIQKKEASDFPREEGNRFTPGT